MQFAKTKLMARIYVLIASVLLSGGVVANSLNEAKAMCSNLSESNRALAKSAGYDVDKLCRGLDSFSGQSDSDQASNGVTIIPRDTVSTTDGRGMVSDDSSLEAMMRMLDPDFEEEKPELKPFGYDLFANVPSSFAAPTNVPVSPNYLLGPGDELSVIFYGKLNESSTVEINRDGFVDFPELGPIMIAGLTFSEAKKMLQTQMESQVIGTKLNISMGALRSMQVFVLGEAFKPGAYSVSALSTITHAIMSAGGVSDIASLRNIKLKRNGKTVVTLDLYDLLLAGDVKNDFRLQASDVIYIPTVGGTVSVDGEVRRPAIYELNGEKTAAEILALAGGLTPKSFASSSRIDRVGDDGFLTVVDLDLTKKSGKRTKIKSGDYLTVDTIIEEKKSIVTMQGAIHHPADYSWREGLKISDLVTSESQFPSDLDLNYALIARQLDELGNLSIVSFKPKDVLAANGSAKGMQLYPRDQIYFFAKDIEEEVDEKAEAEAEAEEKQIEFQAGLNASESNADNTVNQTDAASTENNDSDRSLLMMMNQDEVDDEKEELETREAQIAPLIERLKTEATFGAPAMIVEVKGAVKLPGLYPLTPNMSLTDIVDAAGGLKESAYSGNAEIVRQDNSNSEQSLVYTLSSKLTNEFLLQAQDSVFVKSTPYYLKKDIVTLGGEVVFPGEYTFSRGERLSSIIERAGGFTSVADINAAIFTREKLKEREEQELKRLRQKLNGELSSENLSDASKGEKPDPRQQALKEELMSELNNVEATGRLVIPLQSILEGDADDVMLEAGDNLIIPQFRQEVSVVGEVQRPTSYFFDKRLNYKDYIEQSGGLLQTANKKGIYIVKASGQVVVPGGKFLGASRKSTKIEAGDTIVVPLDTDERPVKGIKLLAEVSQILYQLSLGAAAISSLNN
jgi:protein involved in polysaccharide export with SLBB domain